MGLLGPRSAKGLYRGDAPVSIPGEHGRPPQPYRGPGYSDYTAHSAARAAYGAGQRPVGGANRTTGTAHRSADGVHPTVGPRAARPTTVNTMHSSRGTPPIGILGTKPGRRPDARPSGSGRGAGIFAIIILIMILFAVFSSSTKNLFENLFSSATPESATVTAMHTAPPDTVPALSARDTATVTIHNHRMDVAVLWAEVQPRAGWLADDAATHPYLVLAVHIDSLASDADPVTVTPAMWQIATADGSWLPATPSDSFMPALAHNPVIAGETAIGLVAFDLAAADAGAGDSGASGPDASLGDATPATVTAALTPNTHDEPVAQWQLTSDEVSTGTGTIGEPVTSVLARPGFSITLTNPRIATTADAEVYGAPSSGRLLVIDVRLYGLQGVPLDAGTISSNNFRFVPGDGSAPIKPTPAMMNDVMTTVTITGDDRPQLTRIAFDTAASTGRVEWVDDAGRILLSWPLTLADS